MSAVNASFFALTMVLIALIAVEAQCNLHNGLALTTAEISLRAHSSVTSAPALKHTVLREH